MIAALLLLCACHSVGAPGLPTTSQPGSGVPTQPDDPSQPRAPVLGEITSAVLQRLRAGDPTEAPVVIQVVNLDRENLYGRSQFGRLGWLIQLNVTSPDMEMSETLVHEWAHCVAGPKLRPDEDPHGLTWGQEYSVSFRISRGMRIVERDGPFELLDDCQDMIHPGEVTHARSARLLPVH